MANPQAIPPPTYHYPIPSLFSSHAGLPRVLGNLVLNRDIQAGFPIDDQELVDARSVAKSLRNINDSAIDDRVTAEVAARAEVRATAVEAAHAYAIYSPTNIAQALNQTNDILGIILQRLDGMDQRFNVIDQRFNAIDQRLDSIDGRLESNLAMTHNHRIISRNTLLTVPSQYLPLQKTVHGDGVALATAIYGAVNNLQHLLVQPAQQPVVGTTPPNYSRDIPNYSRATFINLIIFYNEDFGIVAGDTIAQCGDKFYNFLNSY